MTARCCSATVYFPAEQSRCFRYDAAAGGWPDALLARKQVWSDNNKTIVVPNDENWIIQGALGPDGVPVKLDARISSGSAVDFSEASIGAAQALGTPTMLACEGFCARAGHNNAAYSQHADRAVPRHRPRCHAACTVCAQRRSRVAGIWPGAERRLIDWPPA